jgi:hypothetical protein
MILMAMGRPEPGKDVCASPDMDGVRTLHTVPGTWVPSFSYSLKPLAAGPMEVSM